MSQPAGDNYQPVKVHIVADATKGKAAPDRQRKCVHTVCTTYTVLNGDTHEHEILPKSDKRTRAMVFVHSTVGQAASANSYGWIATNISDCRDHQRGLYVTAGGTINVPFHLYGNEAFYFAIDPGATAQVVLSVVAEYEE